MQSVAFDFGIAVGLEWAAADGRMIFSDAFSAGTTGSRLRARIFADTRKTSGREWAIGIGDALPRFTAATFEGLADQTGRAGTLVVARCVATSGCRVARIAAAFVHVDAPIVCC